MVERIFRRTNGTNGTLLAQSNGNLEITTSTTGKGILLKDPSTNNSILSVDTNGFVMSNGLSSSNLILPNNVNINTLSSLPTTAFSGSNTGVTLGWNWSGGGGETDFLSLGQSAGTIGGFDFYATNSTTAPVSIAQLRGTSINFNFT